MPPTASAAHASISAPVSGSTSILRIEVSPAPGHPDPIGDSLKRDAAAQHIPLSTCRATHIYLIQPDPASPISPADLDLIRSKLLADPVTEVSRIGASPAGAGSPTVREGFEQPAARAKPSLTVGLPADPPQAHIVEVHPLPGVMDPVAQSVQVAIAELLSLAVPPQVSTGWRYDLTPGMSESSSESRGLHTPGMSESSSESRGLPTPGMSEAGGGTSESRVSRDTALALAARLLANPVIQKIHAEPFHPRQFPHSAPHAGGMGTVKLRALSDAGLTKLSRQAHLFLSLEEMQAVQSHYTSLNRDPREIELETLAQTWSEHCVHKTLKSRIRYTESGDVAKWQSGKVEAGSATWPLGHSATLPLSPRPGHTLQPDGSILIDNLLRSTVAAATHELIKDGLDWTLSVFSDNSGVIAFDDHHAVCIKVETHNHPSAIEPYGGAATGIGGCIRDIIGTGLGARPIANTDVFCVASFDGWGEGSRDQGTKGSSAPNPGSHDPSIPRSLPQGCLHPRRILTQVVAGVRDYGNRMGIPTVSGGVYFDDRYVGNPLVFCGCIGIMPRNRTHGRVNTGDLIVALGGRTGRDGIHGATFSSAELEHTATDEFAHAVQIGNAITEKQTLDAILRARDDFDQPLYSGLTDCGAGGFSSAVGEMGKRTGATIHLDKAPLKYAGLSPTEIWISEAQERMVLAVPQTNLAKLQAICNEEHVDLAILGTFAPAQGSTPQNPDLALMFHGQEVGRLNMHFLHEGIPTPQRDAVWRATEVGGGKSEVGSPKSGLPSPLPTSHFPLPTSASPPPHDALLRLLSHPNIASKHWIIRQYDHEVRGSTALKPLVGPLGRGPGDASIICPVPPVPPDVEALRDSRCGSQRGLAISQGLQTGIGDPRLGGDPYLMVLAAIDECVRNLVCVGADPDRIAILDNFCWPSCAKPENLGSLVRAAEGCYDGAKAYRTPFVSGKDSLNNQFTTQDGRTIEIPPTLLITGIGIVPDIARACSMDAKHPGNILLIVGDTQPNLGGSHYQQLFGLPDPSNPLHPDVPRVPTTDLTAGPQTARAIASLIRDGLIASAHDASDGGILCAVAEMLIAGSTPEHPIGALIEPSRVPGAARHGNTTESILFGESPSRYILEVTRENLDLARARLEGLPHNTLGVLNHSGKLAADHILPPTEVEALAKAWRAPLDW